MRRRSLVLALPLGLAVLTACDDDGQVPVADIDPDPVLIGELAETVDVSTLRLPLEMIVMIVVGPVWTSRPRELAGIFLGCRELEDRQRFFAVGEDGMILWQADRPLDAAVFALSRHADGTPLAVLGAATLTAYDLRTAVTVWGPIEAPGPQAAPGLLYEDGDGSVVALSASTGEVIPVSGRPLAEHEGTIVHLDGDELVGHTVAEDRERWRIPLPSGTDPEGVNIREAIDPKTALAAVEGAGDLGMIIHVGEGRTIAEDASAVARDQHNDITVVVGGTLVRGLDADGEERWRHDDPEAVHLISAGARLAYAQRPEEGTLVVLDTSQGQMVQPYDVDMTGSLAVPEVFSAKSASSVRVERDRYLVTTVLDEEYGLRE